MERFVLLFGNKLGSFERIAALGYTPIVIHYDALEIEHFIHVSRNAASACQYNEVDFAQYMGVNVCGLVVTSDYYVELAAVVRERMFRNLKGLSLSQARLVRDKYTLKNALGRMGIPTVKYCHLTTSRRDLCSKLGDVFLIKPRRSVQSEGIVRIASEEDWQAWNAKQYKITDYYAEEYIADKREFSCDTIVAEGRVLGQFPGEYSTDCISFRNSCVGIGVNYPGFLSESDIGQLKNLTRAFIEKSGIKDGFFHAEYFYTSQGWLFGEVGCRLPGCYHIPTESYIANVDLIDVYLKIFIESELNPSDRLNCHSAYCGYYMYPMRNGVVERISKSFDYPWIVDAQVYIQEGQQVSRAGDGPVCGHIVYRAESQEELRVLAEMAPGLLSVQYHE